MKEQAKSHRKLNCFLVSQINKLRYSISPSNESGFSNVITNVSLPFFKLNLETLSKHSNP